MVLTTSALNANAEIRGLAMMRYRQRGIEPDPDTLLELVVYVLRMRYSIIGVSRKINFLEIPPFFTYCRFSYFLMYNKFRGMLTETTQNPRAGGYPGEIYG